MKPNQANYQYGDKERSLKLVSNYVDRCLSIMAGLACCQRKHHILIDKRVANHKNWLSNRITNITLAR